MPTLLVVDDEPNVLYSLETSLRDEGYEVFSAATGRQGIDLFRRKMPDAVLLDVRLGDMNGLEVLEQIRGIDSRMPVVLMTAYTTTETAIEATKRGALAYLLKPVDLDELYAVLARAVEVGRLSHTSPASTPASRADVPVDLIVGRSRAMQEVYSAIGRAAGEDVTVLILGESGTGKELVARALHQHGGRADKPFLAINCAAIAENLLESELFGHERGAFTGADRRRTGKFEQADGGTLFLDEVGDMSASTQPKVLRLLQERSFERVGGNEPVRVDVRVVAATNKILSDEVAAGNFRQDLFYRLNGFTIRLPPLRDRKVDIPALVDHFVSLASHSSGQARLTEEALRLLEAHDWPGNVREFQAVIRYALLHATGKVITPDCLPEQIRSEKPSPAIPLAFPLNLSDLVANLLQMGEADVYRKALQEADRVILETALRHTHGNQGRASEQLGISRTTLRAKMRSLGLNLERQLLTDSGQIG